MTDLAARLFRVVTGEGDPLEVLEDEDKAVNARARWMDNYPDAKVEVYERVE